MKLVRWALALVRLGDRRADVESDLHELFEMRSAARGRGYAMGRLIVDVLSVTRSPRRGGLAQDLRFGARLIRKHPTPVAITVAGLALAIAVVTTTFGVVNTTLLRPFNMDDPSTVVSINRPGARPVAWWPYRQFVEWRQSLRLIALEASTLDSARFSTTASSEGASLEPIQFVSGGYFRVFGGRARFGRSLDTSDDASGAPLVVMLGHRFWTERFGADPSVVGRTIWLGESPVTVVGVMEPGFEGPQRYTVNFWAPLASHDELTHGRELTPASNELVSVAGRLVRGASIAAAQQELSVASSGAVNSNGESDRTTRGARVLSARSPWASHDPENTYPAIAMIGVAALVLVLACANAANLLMAGAASRMREMSIRLALGATRARLARQLLTESLLLGVVSGVLGFFLSTWLLRIAIATLPLPQGLDPAPDMRVVLFAAGLAIACGIGAGLSPARFGSTGDLVSALKVQGGLAGRGSTRSRLRLSFVGVQAAVSIFLLVAASLFTRSAIRLADTALGFDADKLLSVSLEIPRTPPYFDRASQRYNDNAVVYLNAALATVRAMPLVESASLVRYPPFGFSRMMTRPFVKDGASYDVSQSNGDAQYFSTTGLRIVRGRTFTAEEASAGAPVALISENVAAAFFGGADPIGRTLSGVRTPMGNDADAVIIGVVGDSLPYTPQAERQGNLYRPIGRTFDNPPTLIVRSQHPEKIIRAVELALLRVNPDVRPSAVSIGAQTARMQTTARATAGIAAGVAAFALVLAILGLYGVTSFAVAQRTREIGVRMTLGATTNGIFTMLLRQSLRPVVIGLSIGLFAALGATQIIASMLAGVSPRDPIAIGVAVALLLAGVLLAIVAPVRLAARTDPASVLRQ